MFKLNSFMFPLLCGLITISGKVSSALAYDIDSFPDMSKIS
jgi:hypothetical protein